MAILGDLAETTTEKVTENEESTTTKGLQHDPRNKPEHVTGNVTQVACGKGLFASSCTQCPYDENGNYHGGFRCGGDCGWNDNECKKGCDFCTGNPCKC